MADSRGPLLSIVLGTYERFARLRRCIEGVRRGTRVDYELVVVDGGSVDGSVEWLRQQPDVRLFVEEDRGGCCKAYDWGFRMARGRYVTWLNDDSYPLEGAFGEAIGVLERDDMGDVGMVSLYHTHDDPWNELHGFDEGGTRYRVMHVRGLPYANFGLLRREVLESVGYLDTAYYFCGWDPDLSLKVQLEAGLKLVSTPLAKVWHEEVLDERKQSDAGTVRTRDNERLFAKWGLPGKGAFADPRPGYRALLESRGLVGATCGDG